MNVSRLSAFCDRVLEAGWLLGVTITPVFFNVYSERVFEPDKLTTLRALATVMAVAWIVRFLEARAHGGAPLRFSWKTPMVLPAVLTMGVYLLSSALSLIPYTSLVGSYQRLQGTYSLFGYLVIFFAIVTSLRTRHQLSRLLTALILNSLPIALYGIVQHNGLDPLPWAGDVQRRVASNMGNAIFVAAYLIMIVPLTAGRLIESFRDILGREEARISDVLRASAYIFLLAVQLLTIWYSQSRGPWLGVVTIAFFLPYLALLLLQQRATAESEGSEGRSVAVLKGVLFGLLSLGVAGLLAGLAVLVLSGSVGALAAVGLGGLAFGGVWVYFVVERKGWRWLWIGWGTVGVVLVTILMLFNVPGFVQTQVRRIQPLYRLTTITELQTGTGKVRGLIWQGTVDLILSRKPITFPDGRRDPLTILRPIVGYGPESMYVAYNLFYPPELGHYESRTASPDRSHNETLDSLVITGVLGLAVYLFTFGGLFCWALHWLNLMPARRDLLRYVGLSIFFAVAFFLIAWRLEGAYLFAVAIPLGLLVGTMVYITWQALRTFLGRHDIPGEPHPHAMLIIALLVGVVAHFVEINFGIAIASTRTTFWAFAGLLVVLGLRLVPGENGVNGWTPAEATPMTPRAKARARAAQRASGGGIEPWAASVLALSLLGLFLLGTLCFNFINNADRSIDPLSIFVNSLTMKYFPEPTRAYGALMIFIFTGGMFGVVGLSEFDREQGFAGGRPTLWRTAILMYVVITFVGTLIVGLSISGHQATLTRATVSTFEEVVTIADRLAGLLLRYYFLIGAVLFAAAWCLMREDRLPRPASSLGSLVVGAVLLLLSFVPIRWACYNPVHANIVFKQGGVFANSQNVNEKLIGISHYERAIAYAPREDYYHLFLGKTYLELAQGLPEDTSPAEREQLFLRTEEILNRARELNPLNTDHSANLARFYKSWAARVDLQRRAEGLSEAEQVALQQKRYALLGQAESNYEIALMLSPNNPILWNELAQLYAVDYGDLVRFQEIISKSLEVDEAFEQTWMLIGDFRTGQGDIDGAVEAYLRSLEIEENCTVRRVAATLMAQQADWERSVDFLRDSVDLPRCQQSADLWEMYRILAIGLTNLGERDAALEAAYRALELAPLAQRAVVEQLVEQLQPLPEAP